jgi:hypothetical protein
MAENFWTTFRNLLRRLKSKFDAADAWVLKKTFGRTAENAELGHA